MLLKLPSSLHINLRRFSPTSSIRYQFTELKGSVYSGSTCRLFSTSSATSPSSSPVSSEGASLLELVKILRKETQAGVADCREALLESNKDIEKAKLLLNKKAKKVAVKKGNRSTYEGGVLVTTNDNGSAVMFEINCETDFAARESKFMGVSRDIASSLLQHPTNDIEKAMSNPYYNTVAGVSVKDVRQALETLTGILKENVRLRRVITFQNNDHIHNFTFVHGNLDNQIPPIGRIGVILRIRVPSSNIPSDLISFVKNLCVHIAANKPTTLHNDPNKEEDEENVLMKQEYLFDSSVTVEKELEKLKAKVGEIEIVEFFRWELSEGVEKIETSLADDVASLLKEKEDL